MTKSQILEPKAEAFEIKNLRSASMAEDFPLLFAPTSSVVSLAKSIRTESSFRKFDISTCWMRMGRP